VVPRRTYLGRALGVDARERVLLGHHPDGSGGESDGRRCLTIAVRSDAVSENDSRPAAVLGHTDGPEIDVISRAVMLAF
jgi:hypothetical protein